MLAVSVYSFRRHLVAYMRLINLIRILWEYITVTEYPNDGGKNDTSYVMFVVCPLSLCFQVLFHLYVWPKSSALRWGNFYNIHTPWQLDRSWGDSWKLRCMFHWLLTAQPARSCLWNQFLYKRLLLGWGWELGCWDLWGSTGSVGSWEVKVLGQGRWADLPWAKRQKYWMPMQECLLLFT